MQPFAEGDLPQWVFGYGSLIWRPDFNYVERCRAVLSGWERRFWQGSTDHRGVPGSPGRVVTLVPVSQGQCVGLAFKLDPMSRDETLQRLDHREQGGYRRLIASVPLPDGRTVTVLTYRADAENSEYLGPAPLPEIASQIKASAGPSGSNVEYVLKLNAALRAMNAVDEHVEALAEVLTD